MGLPGGAGLSDVLAGRATLVEVLQRTPKSNNLLVLAAGSVPPNPSEVLGSERMHGLLADLTKHATVIIDAPPLLPVTDGAVLTHQADGALHRRHARQDDVRPARQGTGHAPEGTRSRARHRAEQGAAARVDASPYSYEYRREYTPAAEAPQEPLVPAGVGSRPGGDLDDLVGQPGAAADTPVEQQRRGGRRG